MGAQLRIYRRRMKSVASTQQITKAQELIAASRIPRAQARVNAAKPYSRAIFQSLQLLVTHQGADHPLLAIRENPKRAAVILITSDRGFAGGYSSAIIKTGDELAAMLRESGIEPVFYLFGRKAVNFFKFRDRSWARDWTGASESPSYEIAQEIGEATIAELLKGSDEGGVDQIHLVYTQYISALTQRPHVRRLLPIRVDYSEALGGTIGGKVEGDEIVPDAAFEYEPGSHQVLSAMLPRYVYARIYAAIVESSAAEQASRRRAMKSASENADELMKNLSRLANTARQAEITQEITEIVGGAEALSTKQE